MPEVVIARSERHLFCKVPLEWDQIPQHFREAARNKFYSLCSGASQSVAAFPLSPCSSKPAEFKIKVEVSIDYLIITVHHKLQI